MFSGRVGHWGARRTDPIALAAMSTSIPLPGQHRPPDSATPAVEPNSVEAEVDSLLNRLPGERDAPMDLDLQAQILERAHDVLVNALSSVDKT